MSDASAFHSVMTHSDLHICIFTCSPATGTAQRAVSDAKWYWHVQDPSEAQISYIRHRLHGRLSLDECRQVAKLQNLSSHWFRFCQTVVAGILTTVCQVSTSVPSEIAKVYSICPWSLSSTIFHCHPVVQKQTRCQCCHMQSFRSRMCARCSHSFGHMSFPKAVVQICTERALEN